MSRHSERFRELREQRKNALRRLNDAHGAEWEERSRVSRGALQSIDVPPPPEKWLTPKKAQAITAGSLAIGGAIVGFLQAIGAFK